MTGGHEQRGRWRRHRLVLPFQELSLPHPASGPKHQGPTPRPCLALTYRGTPPEWVPGLHHHQVKALDRKGQVASEEQVQHGDADLGGLGREQGAAVRARPWQRSLLPWAH